MVGPSNSVPPGGSGAIPPNAPNAQMPFPPAMDQWRWNRPRGGAMRPGGFISGLRPGAPYMRPRFFPGHRGPMPPQPFFNLPKSRPNWMPRLVRLPHFPSAPGDPNFTNFPPPGSWPALTPKATTSNEIRDEESNQATEMLTVGAKLKAKREKAKLLKGDDSSDDDVVPLEDDESYSGHSADEVDDEKEDDEDDGEDEVEDDDDDDDDEGEDEAPKAEIDDDDDDDGSGDDDTWETSGLVGDSVNGGVFGDDPSSDPNDDDDDDEVMNDLNTEKLSSDVRISRTAQTATAAPPVQSCGTQLGGGPVVRNTAALAGPSSWDVRHSTNQSRNRQGWTPQTAEVVSPPHRPSSRGERCQIENFDRVQNGNVVMNRKIILYALLAIVGLSEGKSVRQLLVRTNFVGEGSNDLAINLLQQAVRQIRAKKRTRSRKIAARRKRTKMRKRRGGNSKNKGEDKSDENSKDSSEEKDEIKENSSEEKKDKNEKNKGEDKSDENSKDSSEENVTDNLAVESDINTEQNIQVTAVPEQDGVNNVENDDKPEAMQESSTENDSIREATTQFDDQPISAETTTENFASNTINEDDEKSGQKKDAAMLEEIIARNLKSEIRGEKEMMSALSANRLSSLDGNLRPNSRMIVFNALYFRGNWTTPMASKEDKVPFYTGNGEESKMVEAMSSSGEMELGSVPELGATALDIPYQNSNLLG
ncbi:unnamed protein product [Nesidiocoris tenuis]|uniref:Serpin domain-containing protein n=1 Tax=Nesidiocoris tenuis TaxID=355587 RepID=A0A6H5GSD8_9HEMI|nr:unnamed protein product [Nesidiocoris tenuis]